MSVVLQKLAKAVLLALATTILAACAVATRPVPEIVDAGKRPEPVADRFETSQNSGRIALEAARNMIGAPYRYGGANPRGFDCSGLVQYSFGIAGIKLPRTSQDIFRDSQLIDPNLVQPGDLVFFSISRGKVSHVGIYDGQNRFIHAPSSGKGVSYANLGDPYWRERLVGVGRF